MGRALSCLAILCIFVTSPRLPAQEGRLQRVREEVRGEEKPEKEGKRRESCDHDSAEDCDDGLGSVFGEVCWRVFVAPFTLPPALLGDEYEYYGHFLRHPYQAGLPGYLRLDGKDEYQGPTPEETPLDVSRLQRWMARLTVQESNDFRGLNRVSGQVLLDTTSRFGLQTGWTWLHERLGGGRADDLALGDINLTFRFAQNEYVLMRAGLGARVLADAGRADWGFNFTYGADIFPVRPLVLSAVMDVGTLGEATAFHGRATVGVILSGWELFLGYDYLRIGSVELDGPAVGLRLWF